MNDKALVSFDYAIKYLLKDKGDYSIVEGFISALLKTKGYKSVKIIALLESENNKEDSKSKRSLADLVVEDEDHNKYIIEIERNLKNSFMHKSCFNTARLIVDNLAQRSDYTDILKIFHISLLYFPIGEGGGAIYHGQTIIYEIETNEKLSLHIKNNSTGQIFDAADIFPEYFFISVPLFNGKLQKEIDEWLHVMKHDEVPENYHSPYMAQVAEKLNILKMTPPERDEYFHYQKKIYDDRDELTAAEAKGEARGEARGRAEGIAEGEAKGKAEERRQIAEKLLLKNLAIEDIADITGLSADEILALVKKN